ncbi:MFS transporter [Nocardia wallacei]|uniref:MFS transporter n=1 Tax=Nocardia wallacei TaxID=480035 RepID=UPI00245642E5|nr:MFS transporter [Nocardia wallacei]
MSRPVLRNRNFLLLWSGNTLSLVGFHGVRIAYPLLALSVTGSVALAGWVGFLISLPALIFQIPAGVAADRWDRRLVLIGCQTMGLLATCLAGLVVVLELPNPGLLLGISAFVEGAAYVVFGLSELALIRDVVAVEQRPAAYSFFEAEQPIALVVGRATGAAAFGLARWLPFVANATSYLFCLATLFSIRALPVEHHPSSNADERRESLGAGIRTLWAEPFLRSSTLISGASNVVIQVVILLIIVEIESSGRPVWVAGTVLGAAGVGGIAGSFGAAWLTARFSAQRVYRWALWAWTVFVAAIALSSSMLIVGAAWFGVGAIGTVVNVALTLFRVDAMPETVLGRVVGMVSVVTDGAVALGAIVAGYLLEAFGTTVTGWLLIGGMLALAVTGSSTGRSPNRLERGQRLAPVAEARRIR